MLGLQPLRIPSTEIAYDSSANPSAVENSLSYDDSLMEENACTSDNTGQFLEGAAGKQFAISSSDGWS